MNCKYCGENLLDGQTLCLKCGKSICESKQANKNNSFLFAQSDRQQLNGHSKTAMMLLCFFFGAYGIHNFVMGEAKKGLVKIILSMFGKPIHG